MPRYLLIVDYRPGTEDTPMDRWQPDEVSAHMNYYNALNKELTESGELVGGEALTGPEFGKEVTGDGITAPVVTDGPFAETKEVLAGFQIVEVESEARAIEIAAQVSAVPGPGGVPLQQPVIVRRVMDGTDFDALVK
ncbi:YciI family protein [Paractinoplanes rishiriensis]|uniref:Sigma associated protein n=1 Tax=Paractinoplanes rishiriensis TaxID=1050105 RepID=A0A919MYL2_9ACTN|nr:YciI family protein [Actinoplanes rishiriensis]GIE97175.1 sigma associated protein [Actinoplanes rishiriensis]